jgi:hypothetical protein
MREIGGYFELQMDFVPEYYPNLVRLNSGRHALEYAILANNYKKIYLPRYICDVALEPIIRNKIEFEFYSLNEELAPLKNIEPSKDEALLYVNYFGLKDDIVSQLSKSVRNLIIDNAQAFYAKPLSGITTYYSPRKFFGIPDGGYLSTDTFLASNIEKDISYKRLDHLFIRTCESAEKGYPFFKENEKLLSSQPIKGMSKFTERLLQSINYDNVKISRERNFYHLHKQLKQVNKLDIPLTPISGPMAYPLFIKKKGIKEFLIENKIFVPTYWPNIYATCSKNSLEYSLASFIIALPVDQRYTIDDMDYIINVLSGFISK